MEHKTILVPQGANAHEVNFVISKFLLLPTEDQDRLASAICTADPSSEAFALAGIEVFELATSTPKDELCNYMNEVLSPGRKIFDDWAIFPTDFAAKAFICTHFFRNNLRKNADGNWSIPFAAP